MTPRFRRALALLVPALFLSLAACGGDGEETAKGFDAVTIGDADQPKIDWKATLEPGQKQVKVLKEGTGRALKKNDKVAVDFLLSNGFTHQTEPDTYQTGGAGFVTQVGSTSEPKVAEDLLTGLITKEIKAGTKVGTRMAITVGAEQAFGQYADNLGQFKIGNKDGLLLVFDVLADKPVSGWKAASVSGKFGSSPKVDWKGILDAGKKQRKVLTQGSGPAVQPGQTALVNYQIANGVTHEVDADSFTKEEAGAAVKIGQAAQPQSIRDVIGGAIATDLKAGTKVGTRVTMTVGAGEAFGDNVAALGQQGVSSGDGLVITYDVVGLPAAGPTGKKAKPAAWAPRLIEKKGVPSGFDFKGLKKPSVDDDLSVTTLIKGDGPVVDKGQTIVANYLGQVFKGKQPFDASYPKGETLSFATTDDGGVIDGWIQGVQGVTVGSRIVLQIPPRLGYGEEGNGSTIKGTDTMYFVIDVLGAV